MRQQSLWTPWKIQRATQCSALRLWIVMAGRGQHFVYAEVYAIRCNLGEMNVDQILRSALRHAWRNLRGLRPAPMIDV